MDVDRFETLQRSLADSPSRRQALTLMGGSLLGVMLTQGVSPTDAKKRKRKGKNKKSNRCTPSCGGKLCGDNGCGGSCGSCSGGKACQSGTCQCPAGAEDCQGTCIPASQCCTAADCAATEGCFSGTCVNLRGICEDTEDFCDNHLVNDGTCAGGGACLCLTTVHGQTRCGGAFASDSFTCTSDAQCAAAHPSVPGVFCIQTYGPPCSLTGFFGGRCVAACAT